ncbi:hypothetical protein EZV62_027200 [Acer yangbiense]|uniref:HTH La-type RNA-binding domain-containing protein n=1 Tax=Acer yangbiense TaxID=1000413 RepID=A0A5C7GUX7_9ROSI|nr:hypothetical protein EZV62_027200 [Acer yangbiense]
MGKGKGSDKFWGLQLAHDTGLEPVVAETDAVVVANWITESIMIYSDVGLVIADILPLIQSMRCRSMGYVSRKANVAHFLAKMVLSNSEDLYWMEDSPPCVSRFLQVDKPGHMQCLFPASSRLLLLPLPSLVPEMGGAESPAAAATTTDISTPPSPPNDPDLSPVGSPEHDVVVDDVHGPPSDYDHDNDLDLDQEGQCKDDHLPTTVVVLTDDLKRQIMSSVEYYFSDENLLTDKHMMNLIKKNKQGFVPISVIASFRKMKKLTRDFASIAVALKDSSLIVVSSNGKKVRRLNPLPVTEVRDQKLFTVLVENLPEDHSVENIRRMFVEAGNIKNICIHDPHAVEESKKGKAEILISNKNKMDHRLHALVEYETVEAAEKAVATLNNEQDWRNGMRVKLLQRMGKYGHKMQAWRGSESEKNGIGHASEQTGDEENHNSSEHHEDTHDEEEGDHLSKEKNGQKGRNRGRVRRNGGNSRYRGTNGLGHGTGFSTHVVESKPPPGPRMPDGTRGFTMGRGRPPVASQS